MTSMSRASKVGTGLKPVPTNEAGMDPFQTAEIGNTGLHLSRLGLGGAGFGSSERSAGEAVSAIGHALELGMRDVDTAPLYFEGRSELRLGAALAKVHRDSYIISTKVGRLLKIAATEDMPSVVGYCESDDGLH